MRTKANFRFNLGLLIAFILVLNLSAEGAEAPSAKVSKHRIIKTLVLIYNPVLVGQENKRLAEFMKWNDPFKQTLEVAKALNDASGGFAEFKIVKTIQLNEFPIKRDGFRYDEASFLDMWKHREKAHSADSISYQAIFDENKITSQLKNGEVDEVWIWGAPYFGYDEYAMKLPGDKIFYTTTNPWFYRPYDIPDCGRMVWVMGFNYERGVAEAIHSFGHRCEGILSLTVGKGKWYDAEPENPWRAFSLQDVDHPAEAGVGNVHGGPNAQSGYDYAQEKTVMCSAEDWLNYPNLAGKKTPINCEAWGGPDYQLSYMKWYLSHIPKAQGVTSGVYNNWWQYLVNYDEAVELLPPPGGSLMKATQATY
jgi:hypothetical protein